MKKYFIGIDVSKETVDVSFVESDFQRQPDSRNIWHSTLTERKAIARWSVT